MMCCSKAKSHRISRNGNGKIECEGKTCVVILLYRSFAVICYLSS
uniref:Uncharacterized protein n=1 Tax=Lepeophtheirus salmonis TaxID=72036 RepID=A0A0K2VEG3_LEPSM